jgi:hypothetical protein
MKAGAGKVFVDLARGAGQFVRDRLESPMRDVAMFEQAKGAGPSRIDTRSKLADAAGLPNQADIDEARRLEAPLMDTKAGMAGNIIGSAALLAPTALAPAAATPTGAGIIGGGFGALQPVGGGEDRAKNAAVGTAVAGATQVGANAIGGALANRAQTKATEAAALKAQNAVRDAALEAGKKAGYVVPPASVKPGLVNEAIESVGGKIATAQSASTKNQRVTDTLAREYLGMPKDSILSPTSLADLKNVAAAPYREIAAVSPEAKTALDAWKQANFDAKMQWTYFRKSGNPEAYAKAQELGKVAEGALDAIEQQAARAVSGAEATSLVEALKAARVKIAQIHTVESAMTKGGHVDAKAIAKLGERAPLSGPLKTIADFAGQFPKAVQTPEKVGGMATALRPTVGAGIGTVIGGPAGAVVGGGAGVAVPWAAREAMLSTVGQRLATPSYNAGGQLAARLADSRVARGALPQTIAGAILQNRAQE